MAEDGVKRRGRGGAQALEPGVQRRVDVRGEEDVLARAAPARAAGGDEHLQTREVRSRDGRERAARGAGQCSAIAARAASASPARTRASSTSASVAPCI